MKERPIIFSGPMVRAILAGRKTQTRRVVKPQPDSKIADEAYWNIGGFRLRDDAANPLPCPYGSPGDRLWVRETFSVEHCYAGLPPSLLEFTSTGIWYWADGNPHYGDWTKPKPSIHMPRWASRITLEITGVRVERLNDISEVDAAEEGVRYMGEGEGYEDYCHGSGTWCTSSKASFTSLWESINGPGSWALNPWVWVVEFKRL